MRHGLLTLLFMVAVTTPGTAQELLHYWNFNSGAGPSGTSWPSPIAPTSTVGGAHIDHNLADGTLQDFAGSTLNARPGDPAGGSFSVQAGVGNVNNGRHFDLVIPSSDYAGIVVEYATRGTASGFQSHEIHYSIDGTTFDSLTTVAANTTAEWSLTRIDLASIPAADDNADLIIRVILDGGSSVSGNNRFDNIAVRGFAESENRPPYFSATLDDRMIDAGELFSFQYVAVDPNDDPLTFSLVNAPDGASIDVASGLFTWSPTVAQGDREWTITVAVTDGQAVAETSAALYVVAFPENAPPVLTAALPDTLLRVGDALTYVYEAEDADGDELTFELLLAPEGVSFDPVARELTWTVTTPGAYPVVISVTDNMATVLHESIVGVRGLLFPGLEGAELRERLREGYLPAQVLGYDAARDSMYAVLDLEADGYVRGVYSGYAVRYEGTGTPRSIMSAGGIDAEHTWPQSRGAGSGMPQSDLHHLFPTLATVNNARGNLPFAEIPAANVIRWYRDDTSVTSTPADAGTYSRLAAQSFQPRDVHLGPAARSTLYFYAAYEDVADAFYFAQQAETVARWAEQFVPTPSEVRRTHTISTWQGNVNPFIFDSTLAARIIVDVEQPQAIPIGDARLLEDGQFVMVEGIVTRAKGRYLRLQDETGGLTTFQAFGALSSAIERGDVAEGDSLRIAGPMATFNGLRQIGSVAMFDVMSRGNGMAQPVPLTFDEIATNGEIYESMLITVGEFLVQASGVFEASTTYSLLSAADSSALPVALRIQRATDSDLVGEPIPADRAMFTGVLGRFNDTFQLEGVRTWDVQSMGLSAPELPEGAVSVTAVYPNPTSGRAEFHVEAAVPQHIRAELIDALGRRVAVLHDGMIYRGAIPITLEMASLPSGLYFVRIASEAGIEQRSVVVVR
jgi:hypothetical protein